MRQRKMTSVRQASKSRAPSGKACLRSAMPILRTTGGARSCASQAPSIEWAADPRACPVSLRRSHRHSMGFLTWGCVAMVASSRTKVRRARPRRTNKPWQPVVALTSSPVRRPRRAAICHALTLPPIAAEVSPLLQELQVLPHEVATHVLGIGVDQLPGDRAGRLAVGDRATIEALDRQDAEARRGEEHLLGIGRVEQIDVAG